MSLTFADASFVVGVAGSISGEKAETFRSRMKQWQKKGFPAGTQVGKGVKAKYGARETLQLILMVKLLKVGLTPERAQYVIESAWAAFQDGFVEAAICLANNAGHLHYFMIQVDALSELTTPGSDHTHVFVELLTDDEMAEAWKPSEEIENEDEQRRYDYFSFLVKNRMALSITIEIDSLWLWLWAALVQRGFTPDLFSRELADWESERRKRGRIDQPDQEPIDKDIFRGSYLSALQQDPELRFKWARAALSEIEIVTDGNS